MENSPIDDTVVNALSLLKRVHRLSGSVAILHGNLVHAEVSLKAFSSDRFTKAVQSIFDGFAQRKRRAKRIAMVFEGQNLLLISCGPMIVGFFFEKLADLDTVEAGINRFIEQFGSALQMDDPEPEVPELEAVSQPEAAPEEDESSSEAEPVVVEPTRTLIAGSSKMLRKIEVDEPGAEDLPDEDIDEPGASEPNLTAVFRKVLPPSVAATMSTEEVLAAIPDRRIRKMIENEITELADA